MLLLTATTDKLQLTTSSTAAIDVHASWMDHTLSTDNVEGGRTNTAISTATTTDVLAAPASGVTRNCKTLHARNKSASASNDVTVIYNQSGTAFELVKVTLLPGEQLEYVEGVGFFTLRSPTAQVRLAKLGADQSNSTTTPTELTGMSLTTGVGTFKFDYDIVYQSSVTTTGVKFSVNHTGTVSLFVANLHMATADTTATATQTGVADQDVIAVTTHLYQVLAARAKSNAGWGVTAGVDTANADMFARIEGLMVVTVDGDIELWHGSETAAATTVKAGTSLELIRTGD